MNEIKIFDDQLNVDVRKKIFNIVTRISYTNSEPDSPGLPPVGRTVEILNVKEENIQFIHNQMLNVIKTIDELKNLSLYRAYINHFLPEEDPYWHIDGEGLTLLYYPNIDFDENDNGETLFLNTNNYETSGVCAIPGRFVLFHGMHKHRATTFRNKERYSIAYKFN